MIELYQLIQLLVIAECGTISGAAEQLHLSQPALSRSMQKLEDILQVTLFDRQRNKLLSTKWRACRGTGPAGGTAGP